MSGYFNPRPREGGDLFVRVVALKHLEISIHAPREGGDMGFPVVVQQLHLISIHAPREGGDSKA